MTKIQGKFIGALAPEWLEGGRLMKLTKDFTFIDGKGIIWTARSGTVIDGASIPQILWSFLGGPFEGLYRKSSIVHDYYCYVKERPWQLVHRMFYDACLVEGLNEFQAKVMYAGVYAGGPRWVVGIGANTDKSIIDTGLEGLQEAYQYNLIPPTNFIKTTKVWIEEQNPSLNEIDNRVNIQIENPYGL